MAMSLWALPQKLSFWRPHIPCGRSPEAQLLVLESRIQTLRLRPGSSGERVQAQWLMSHSLPEFRSSDFSGLDQSFGCGSKLKKEGYAGFSLRLHLRRCNFGTCFSATAMLVVNIEFGYFFWPIHSIGREPKSFWVAERVNGTQKPQGPFHVVDL